MLGFSKGTETVVCSEEIYKYFGRENAFVTNEHRSGYDPVYCNGKRGLKLESEALQEVCIISDTRAMSPGFLKPCVPDVPDPVNLPP
ncbi:unnamed protein product [Cylicostephanus goldi]|uniref:Uncharacterized protein n=1 Tax=Cylicostephanus goldi TaxID=71465 RepID=A0A3P7N9N8_CYLGO|nr:unnamed protein product [Cylicostephanus goldi]